jgi:hypothetical protein
LFNSGTVQLRVVAMSSLLNDFTLTFDGFYNESPDALREFKALCATDLALSVEETAHILSKSGERVLFRHASAAELVRLANHFRAIGARVNVDRSALVTLETTLHQDPTSEVDRLFADVNQLQRSMQRTSYGFHSNTDAQPVISHFTTIEPTIAGHQRAPTTQSCTSSERLVGFFAACGIGSLIIAAGVVNTLFAGKVRGTLENAPSAHTARQKLEQASNLALNAPAETLSWAGATTNPDQNYKLQISALQMADVISVRMAVFEASERTALPLHGKQMRFRQLESDPGVLRKVAPERWQGDLPVYIFLTDGEKRQRLVGAAHVAVTGGSSLTAHISVTLPELNEGTAAKQSGLSVLQHTDGSYSFSLSDTLELKR